MSRRLLMLLCVAQFAGCGSCNSPGPAPIPVSPFGRFDGRVVAEWDDDGRFMTLRREFAYIDPANKRWHAPSGARINGASIPRVFWSIMGGPYEGRYRNASVVHDVYCESMSEPCEDVHEMFYHACRCGGMDESTAKLMYWAVYRHGPQWEMPAPPADGPKTKSYKWEAPAPAKYQSKAADESTVAAAKAYFETHNPTLDEIKRLDIAPR